MTLQLFHSELPFIRGKFYFLFYQCSRQAVNTGRKKGTSGRYLRLVPDAECIIQDELGIYRILLSAWKLHTMRDTRAGCRIFLRRSRFFRLNST